jgi:hypothetical protein
MGSPVFTYQMRVFVEHYAETLNATAAASLAGYSNPKQAGSRLLTYPHVRTALEEKLGEKLPAARTRYQAAQEGARRLMVFQANGHLKLTYGHRDSVTERLRKSLPCPVKLLLAVAPKDGEKAAGPIRERFRKTDREWWQLTPAEREELLAAVRACGSEEA